MILFHDDIKNAYQVLGLSNGDEETVKKAYRKAALRCHPDVNKEDPLSNNEFLKITNAYQTLTEYFGFLKKQSRSPFSFESFSFQKDLRLGVSISLEEAYCGCKKVVNYSKNIAVGHNIVQQPSSVIVDINEKARQGQVLKIKKEGNVRDGESGDLYVIINYPYSVGDIKVTPNGAIFSKIFVNWADVLIDKEIRFNLFPSGPLIKFTPNGEYDEGYTYQINGMGFLPVAPLFVQVFYKIPCKIRFEDRKKLSEILGKYT